MTVARAGITLLTLAALVLICYLTLRHRRPPASERTRRPAWTTTAWVALVAGLAHPVLDTLIFGQINLILVGLALADIFLIRGRWRGVAVGIATGIKLTPGLFILYFLVTGQYRAARQATASAAATVAIGLIVQPEAAWAFFTRHMLNPARTGNVTYAGNQSILATAWLLRDPLPSGALTLGLSALVVIIALLVARQHERAGRRLVAVSVVAVAALLASPISWTHHWVWFIPCFGVVTAWAGTASRRWWPVGAAAAVIWTCRCGSCRNRPKRVAAERGSAGGDQQLRAAGRRLPDLGCVVGGGSDAGRGRSPPRPWPRQRRRRNLRLRNLR